jgi:zinc protease
MRSRLLLAALCVAGITAAHGATTTDVPGADAIVSRTLDNGLKIVVWPDHDIPNVALYTWYRAGGRNEYPGITGIAHYFEHMMFNGTSTSAPGDFDRVMEANGGANNAYTSVDNNNIGALLEQVRATAFVAHPYQFPVIGWPSDIENWSLDDLKSFYKTYYAPNNATMFVVGDVDPTEVLDKIEARFGAIPKQPAPDPVTTVEPEQQGERRLVLEKPGAQAPMLVLAYHVGREADAEMRATELLVSALTGGESSRLHQRLVERDQLAVSVGGFIGAGFDPGLLYLYAVLPPGGDVARVEAAIQQELDRIAREGVRDAELDKARNQQQAGFWRSLATISGKAQALGDYEIFHGDYRKLFQAPASFDEIKPAQLKPLAERVFRESNRTVGVLRPTAAASEE